MRGIPHWITKHDSPGTVIEDYGSSIMKQEATQSYGAEVVLHGETFREALEYALLQKEYTFIHAYDDPDIIERRLPATSARRSASAIPTRRRRDVCEATTRPGERPSPSSGANASASAGVKPRPGSALEWAKRG